MKGNLKYQPCFLVNYRIKTVCENGTLRLRCRNKSVLTIFSANYGKFMEGKQECDVMNKNGPVIGMLEIEDTQIYNRLFQILCSTLVTYWTLNNGLIYSRSLWYPTYKQCYETSIEYITCTFSAGSKLYYEQEYNLDQLVQGHRNVGFESYALYVLQRQCGCKTMLSFKMCKLSSLCLLQFILKCMP